MQMTYDFINCLNLFCVWHLAFGLFVNLIPLLHNRTICVLLSSFWCSIGASVAILYDKKLANYPLTLGRKGGRGGS